MANTALAGTSKPGQSIGTTNDSFSLGRPCRQVALVNTHATQQLYAKPVFSTSPAGLLTALAAAVTATITATSDDTFHVPPVSGRRVIAKMTGRPRYVGFVVLGSGATTTFDVEGTDFFD